MGKDDKLNQIFAENLNYFMNRDGKIQADIAKYLGVSTATVSDWCSGNKYPRGDKLAALCDLFNIELADLMSERRKDEYYIDPAAAKAAQEMMHNKDLKVLFEAARTSSAEDLQTTYNMLMALKRKETHADDDTGC